MNRLLPLVLWCAVTHAMAAAPADPFAAQRAEFQQAYAAVGAPQAPTFVADSPSLRGYILYPYLQSARLSRALRQAGGNVPVTLDEQIADFVRAHEGQPVAAELRRNWLASLADRRQWSRFLAFHRPDSDDASLRCHGYTARLELQQTDGLAADIAATWLTPRSVRECERAFDYLRDTGALTPELIEQRARLALDNNNPSFARQVVARLPAERAAPLLRWAALLENPRREIDALIASPQLPVEPAALLAGWKRLARADRTAARQRLDALVRARGMDRRAASPYALALALPLSWDRDAAALTYFARVEAADFDDTTREWQARAALWNGDWKLAARAIAAMSEANRNSARWRYWSARVAAQAGDHARARQLYESVLPDDNYYSGMAAARLERQARPNPQRLPRDESQLTRLEAMLPLARARELRLSGLVRDAINEWRFGVASLQPPELSQAVHLASRWGWHDQAIATATAARVFNDYELLYPRPYDGPVAAAARLTGLEPELIYGVIRQESLFRPDAVSSADARGLMQLLPETARRTARQWQLPTLTNASLADPAVNVRLGAGQLKLLLDRFDGQIPLALAGYNAGPNAVRRWLPSAPMDPDIWIENIPYNETRTYVQRILWHRLVFAWLRTGAAQDTRSWLAPVRPVA